MPELPEITLYVESLAARVVGRTLARIQLASPFVLRTVEPPVDAVAGSRIESVRRLGKRIVWQLEGELYAVVHLMVAGRLLWLEPGKRAPRKGLLATFELSRGGVALVELSPKKRASLHILRGPAALAALDPGGLEPLEAPAAEISAAIRRESHTLKRALTDPRILSGVGNTYSDEILHRARLSPLKLTGDLDAGEMERLVAAVRHVLADHLARLRARCADRFPTPAQLKEAKRELAVHGRFAQPCPECGTTIQRIRYAETETDYCPRCQTGGRVLADRSLSRLLKQDWPRSIEELEGRPGFGGGRGGRRG